jgi:hypothetical protein
VTSLAFFDNNHPTSAPESTAANVACSIDFMSEQ